MKYFGIILFFGALSLGSCEELGLEKGDRIIDVAREKRNICVNWDPVTCTCESLTVYTFLTASRASFVDYFIVESTNIERELKFYVMATGVSEFSGMEICSDTENIIFRVAPGENTSVEEAEWYEAILTAQNRGMGKRICTRYLKKHDYYTGSTVIDHEPIANPDEETDTVRFFEDRQDVRPTIPD